MPEIHSAEMTIDISLAELVESGHLFHWVNSSVAIFNDKGETLFSNQAYNALDNMFVDPISCKKQSGIIADTRSVAAAIQACVEANATQTVNETFYYNKQIQVSLTIVLAPIHSTKSGTTEGVFLTIAEESIEFDNHSLARNQYLQNELRSRILTLSQELKDKEQLVQSLLKETPFAIMLLDAKRNVLQINKACEKILKVTNRDAMGRSCDNFLHCYQNDNRCPLLDNHQDIHAQPTPCLFAGSTNTTVLRSTVLLSESSDPVIIETFIDISERLQSEVKMQKLSRALEQTADSVIITDTSGSIEYVNKAFEDITGYNASDAIGKLPSLIKSGKHNQAFYSNLWKTIQAGGIFRDVLTNRKKNGELYHEEKTITPLRDKSGKITHYISTGKDITDRMEAQERLRYLAYHDPLTGLPNRSLFTDRLEHAVQRSKRNQTMLAVLFLDVDRFKSINDTLGHAAGDDVLTKVSSRILRTLRTDDTVARFGGDEFAILLEDIQDVDSINPIAKTILRELEKSISIEQRELVMTISIGISVYPSDTPDPQTLMKYADIAMYRAKEKGRNTYQYYSQDMGIKAFERMIMETSLRQALEKSEFVLSYQPLVELTQRQIIGVEALVRWRHPDLGLVMPNEFIPVLEETGLIVATGEWILKQACRDITLLQQKHQSDIQLSVNMSSQQFSDPGLPQLVQTTLHENNILPQSLEIEITENVLVDYSDTILKNFEKLAAMGVKIAIDDFGTGYSSLSYLKRFPIHTLKIDRTFVNDITSNKNDAAIVQAIVAMANSFDLNIVAEGVENEKQLQQVEKYGCHLVQGFYFSEPVELEKIMDFTLDYNKTK